MYRQPIPKHKAGAGMYELWSANGNVTHCGGLDHHKEEDEETKHTFPTHSKDCLIGKVKEPITQAHPPSEGSCNDYTSAKIIASDVEIKSASCKNSAKQLPESNEKLFFFFCNCRSIIYSECYSECDSLALAAVLYLKYILFNHFQALTASYYKILQNYSGRYTSHSESLILIITTTIHSNNSLY